MEFPVTPMPCFSSVVAALASDGYMVTRTGQRTDFTNRPTEHDGPAGNFLGVLARPDSRNPVLNPKRCGVDGAFCSW